MLLGFYDRNNNGLAVELTPEMAASIAHQARGIFGITRISSFFEGASEIRLSRHAFECVHGINWQYTGDQDRDGFVLHDGHVFNNN